MINYKLIKFLIPDYSTNYYIILKDIYDINNFDDFIIKLNENINNYYTFLRILKFGYNIFDIYFLQDLKNEKSELLDSLIKFDNKFWKLSISKDKLKLLVIHKIKKKEFDSWLRNNTYEYLKTFRK